MLQGTVRQIKIMPKLILHLYGIPKDHPASDIPELFLILIIPKIILA